MGLLDRFKKKGNAAELAERQKAKGFMLPPDVTEADKKLSHPEATSVLSEFKAKVQALAEQAATSWRRR